MGQLATAIQNLLTAQRAYEAARTRRASTAKLVELAEAVSCALIAHGEALPATPRTQWQAEADTALVAQQHA